MVEDLDAAAAPATAESAEELEATVHALRHRLRNAFAVSSAITLASAREAPDHQEFAAALAQRFSTLSLVQARLLDGPATAASLAQLVAELTEAYAVGAGTVRLTELPDVALSEQQARLVALVLGELCANSVRHGALAHGGEPVVSGALAGGTLAVAWDERLPSGSAGREAGEVEDGGRRLLVRMARAHGATLAWEESDGAVRVRLELPVA